MRSPDFTPSSTPNNRNRQHVQTQQQIERCNSCGLEQQITRCEETTEKNLYKVLGYTPLVSQLTSLLCLATAKPDMAMMFQIFFAQGFINSWKRLFYAVYILLSTASTTCRQWANNAERIQMAPNHTNSHRAAINTTSWMIDLQHARLRDLCLPATHNSHAYACRPTPLGTDWILCQTMTVYEQLEAGIRLLDLRIASDKYFGHGPALTVSIERVAKDICEFVSRFPSEVVVCVVKANNESNCTINAKQKAARIFKEALEKSSMMCSCSTNDKYSADSTCTSGATRTNSIVIDFPENIHASNDLKKKSLAELNKSTRQGRIIVDTDHFWEGSWKYTRSSTAKSVVRKCEEWATLRASGLATCTGERNYCSQNKPRLLELIVTVDAGTTGETAQLLLIHSVHTLNLQLIESTKQHNLLSPSFLSKMQAVSLDYPTKEDIYSIVCYNNDVTK